MSFTAIRENKILAKMPEFTEDFHIGWYPIYLQFFFVFNDNCIQFRPSVLPQSVLYVIPLFHTGHESHESPLIVFFIDSGGGGGGGS